MNGCHGFHLGSSTKKNSSVDHQNFMKNKMPYQSMWRVQVFVCGIKFDWAWSQSSLDAAVFCSENWWTNTETWYNAGWWMNDTHWWYYIPAIRACNYWWWRNFTGAVNSWWWSGDACNWYSWCDYSVIATVWNIRIRDFMSPQWCFWVVCTELESRKYSNLICE